VELILLVPLPIPVLAEIEMRRPGRLRAGKEAIVDRKKERPEVRVAFTSFYVDGKPFKDWFGKTEPTWLSQELFEHY
jgi:hypothetical protein